MTYLIGTDEAGYGPNLGPLAISATVWEVPDGIRAEDLYRHLEGVVAREPGRDARRTEGSGFRVQGSGVRGQSRAVSARPVAIADSKRLYHSGKGIGLLERGLLAAMAVTGHRPATWREVWSALAPSATGELQKVPWYADYDVPVPLDALPAAQGGMTARLGGMPSRSVGMSGEPHGGATDAMPAYDMATQATPCHPDAMRPSALAAGLASAGVRLLAIHSRPVFEGEFNDLLERHPSKGAALSHETLRLVADAIGPLGNGPIHILCDKHGGRNTYRELLEKAFPDRLIEVYGEGREQSNYRFGPPERRIEIRFQAKAEAHLPAALASMASKYLRELAMRAFNAFWCQRVPGLAPTAGYPLDARRFKTAIAAAQAELGIPDRLLWRSK